MSITIKTKYIVYNHDGTGIRHHHYTDQNTVHSFPDETAAENEAGNRTASAPDKYAFGTGPDLSFAFMTINGAADGIMLYTTAGDYAYHIGTQDINILVVYAPASTGGGDGKPAVWVDAFNVDAGVLSDDVNFISILTPPNNILDAAATYEANQEGDVITTAAEHLLASETIDGGVPFVEWKQILPAQSIVVGKDISLAQGEGNEIWIAFYQTPSRHIPVYKGNYALWQWVDYATKVDGHGGPGDQGFAVAAELHDFAVGIALAATASEVNKELRTELLNIAGKQVLLASKAIERKIAEMN